MDELQKCELVIARILNLLMAWGIQECDLRFEELGLDPEYAPFFFPCVVWLRDEGIIRCHAVEQLMHGPGTGLVSRPVLTAQGMHLLGLKRPIGDAERNVSDAVRDVSGGHSSYARVGNFTGGLLASFIKSMG